MSLKRPLESPLWRAAAKKFLSERTASARATDDAPGETHVDMVTPGCPPAIWTPTVADVIHRSAVYSSQKALAGAFAEELSQATPGGTPGTTKEDVDKGIKKITQAIKRYTSGFANLSPESREAFLGAEFLSGTSLPKLSSGLCVVVGGVARWHVL